MRITLRRHFVALAAATLVVGAVPLLVAAPATANHGTRTLQVLPEVASVNAGDTVTLTATLSTAADVATGAINVDFEVETAPADTDGNSPTTPDATCDIVATQCTVTVTAAGTGTSLIRAWIDHDDNDATRESDLTEGRLSNGLPPPAPTADCTDTDNARQAACFSGDQPAAAGTVAEADDTDVVKVTWTGTVANLDCTPETQRKKPNETIPVVCKATDVGGLAKANVLIDAENQDGVNDPDNQDGGTADFNTGQDTDNAGSPVPGAPGSFCTTAADGTCTATISTEQQEGVAVVCFWADQGEANTANTGNRVYNKTGTETRDGAGCAEAVDDTEDDLTDRVELRWELPALSAVDVQPDTQTKKPGETVTLTATAYDQFGDKVGAAVVNFELFLGSISDTDGNNPPPGGNPDKTCTTAGGTGADAGTCSISYSAAAGTDLLCAWVGTAPVLSGGVQGGTCDGEGRADPTADDGKPSPVDDRLDVVEAIWQNPAPPPSGYWLVASDGGVFAFGEAGFFGSTGNIKLNQPIVGLAATPTRSGYWMVARDGGIFAFGDATFHGSTGDIKLNQPIVAMDHTPSGKGYWMVASDGGVFAFGDAKFFGSTGNTKLNKPIVTMAATPSGQGYWMVASDGGVFAFGDAGFFGSTGNLSLAKPIVAMAATPTGKGYWMVASDGGVFAFGDAAFFGSTGDRALNKPIVSAARTSTGKGYWFCASDGGIFAFGDAAFRGSTGDRQLNQPIVAMDGF